MYSSKNQRAEFKHWVGQFVFTFMPFPRGGHIYPGLAISKLSGCLSITSGFVELILSIWLWFGLVC